MSKSSLEKIPNILVRVSNVFMGYPNGKYPKGEKYLP